MRTYLNDGTFYYYCPGCKHAHWVKVDGTGGENRNWTWNGFHEDLATLAPSIREFTPAYSRTEDDGTVYSRPERTLCHHHVVNGVIDFLDDSATHTLRGKHPLPHFPEGYGIGNFCMPAPPKDDTP